MSFCKHKFSHLSKFRRSVPKNQHIRTKATTSMKVELHKKHWDQAADVQQHQRSRESHWQLSSTNRGMLVWTAANSVTLLSYVRQTTEVQCSRNGRRTSSLQIDNYQQHLPIITPGTHGYHWCLLQRCDSQHRHTHTCLTALCLGLPGWAGTRKVKPIWILMKQETVSGSGISWATCKSAPCSRQITMPAPHHSVFYRPDALPAAEPIASKHWRQYRQTDSEK